MSCAETQELIHAYVDRELDLAHNLEIERHLRECPACAAFDRRLRALRSRFSGETSEERTRRPLRRDGPTIWDSAVIDLPRSGLRRRLCVARWRGDGEEDGTPAPR